MATNHKPFMCPLSSQSTDTTKTPNIKAFKKQSSKDLRLSPTKLKPGSVDYLS